MSLTPEAYQAMIDRANQASMAVAAERDITIADCFEVLVAQQGDTPFVIFEGRQYSYAEVDSRAAEIAMAIHRLGIGRGDAVALMMENRIEFFYAWLAILKLGACVALINTQAKSEAVRHAVTTVNSRLAIVGSECYARYRSGCDAAGDDARGFSAVPVFVVGDDGAGVDTVAVEGLIDQSGSCAVHQTIEQAVAAVEQPFDKALRDGINNQDTACYIFTSGTTGLPKAALINHFKWLSTGRRWLAVTDIDRRDIFYCVIPIFHGAGLMSLFSTVFAVGGVCVLRRKFSAREFWQDIAQHQITVAIYVGEICRYLLSSPVVAEEKGHTLRVLLGAGMGGDIWLPFVDRFGEHIQIREGWGSTEANCNMINFDNQPGACGRIPYWDKTFMRLVQYDVESDSHRLGDDGFYLPAKAGVVGELLGQVYTGSGQPVSPFDGYSDAAATEKKLLRDVFEKGDCWFSSGDLFRYDEQGYFYFVDRVGDTFRWKSENVSTTEVAQQLSRYTAAEMINVYGVQVPGQEGRAGMAALVMAAGERFDAAALYRLAVEVLPSYAVPLFVRVMAVMDMTGTYKLRKVELQREGYHPDNFSDALFVLDHRRQCYAPYDEALLDALGVAAFEKLSVASRRELSRLLS